MLLQIVVLLARIIATTPSRSASLAASSSLDSFVLVLAARRSATASSVAANLAANAWSELKSRPQGLPSNSRMRLSSSRTFAAGSCAGEAAEQEVGAGGEIH